MLKKVISGGQTGMDAVGLQAAFAAGIVTGGTAAKYWMTEDGYEPSLARYGLVECDVEGYPARTEKNVVDSDATVLFGDMESYGSKLTKRLCKDYGKPCILNPTSVQLLIFIKQYRPEVLNIAGNRASKTTKKAMLDVYSLLVEVFSIFK